MAISPLIGQKTGQIVRLKGGLSQRGERSKSGKRDDLALANAKLASQNVSETVVTWVKRSRYNPLRQLTPEYLSRIIDTWNNGYLREFALMADAIKHRDPIINIGLRKREKGVARHGFEVLLIDGLDKSQKARAQQHQEAIKWFFDHCTVSHVLEQDTRGGFRLLVEQMMAAQGDRYAVHEIVYQPTIDPVSGAPRLTAEFNYVPPWFFEATTGHLRFIRHYFGSVFGEEMEDDAWLVTIGEGIIETLSGYFVIKHAALAAWASYSERFGTPGVHGKTSAAKNSPAWDDFATAIATFGEEWATITSQDASIELIEAKGGAGGMPFEKLVEVIDKTVATVCRGGDLSTLSSGAHGSGGQGRGASVQADETELLEQDDAELITETLQKVSRTIVRQLFGDQEPLAYVQIIVPEKKNNQDTIAKLTFLVNSGVQVGAEFARKELGIPPPIDGEELLKPVQNGAQIAAADNPESALANAAHPPVDAGAAVFQRNAVRKLSEAESTAMKPLLDRIATLKDLPDAQFATGLRQLRDDLPRLFAEARLNVPGIAAVWEQVLGTALVDGLAEKPSTK